MGVRDFGKFGCGNGHLQHEQLARWSLGRQKLGRVRVMYGIRVSVGNDVCGRRFSLKETRTFQETQERGKAGDDRFVYQYRRRCVFFSFFFFFPFQMHVV